MVGTLKQETPASTAMHIIGRILIYAILILGAAILVFPYFWMVLTTFKDDYEAMNSLKLDIWPDKWLVENYKEIWTKVPFLTGVKNTLIVEVANIVVGTFFSAMAAFSFAKLQLRGKNFWLLLLMSSMMVPYAALMMPQYRVFQSLGMVDTLWPIILPGFFGNISMIFFLVQYLKGISNSFFEAAKIDGAGYLRMFLSIAVPLMKTAISAQIVFWFIGIWNDYFAPAIYLDTKEKMTLQPMLEFLNSSMGGGTNLPLIMTGAVLSSIPMFIIYISCQKYFIESLAISGVKG